MTEEGKILLEYLRANHVGEENAITDRELGRSIGLQGTRLRETVNMLRVTSHPICSSTRGYYYAGTKDEINETMNHLEGRAYALYRAVLGLEAAMGGYEE